MSVLLLAAGSAHLGVFAAALCFGLLVGLLGHVTKSRALIVAGIVVIGLISAYFSFVLQPSGR